MTFRDNVGAMASSNLAILTIWKLQDGFLENRLGNRLWLYYQRGHSDLILLTRTFRVTMGANTSPDLDILTIWDPSKGTFGKD